MSKQRSEDELLIDRIKGGDKDALDILIRKYEERAYRYAFRLTRDSEQAGDVVAESFLRVYNALKNFRGQSAFGTWLYRIVTNCYLDSKKRDKSHNDVSLDTPVDVGNGELGMQFADTGMSPEDYSERNARDEVLQEGLSHLPEYQRAMIVMYHLESLSYEEIAQALDLPIGTVKSRLNRARQALKDLLKDHMELFQIS